jgi:hypothetical protein
MLNYNYANFHLSIERKVFHGGVTRTMVEGVLGGKSGSPRTEKLKTMLMNKHSQRQQKTLPPKELEYDEAFQLPPHTLGASIPSKEFTCVFCQV